MEPEKINKEYLFELVENWEEENGPAFKEGAVDNKFLDFINSQNNEFKKAFLVNFPLLKHFIKATEDLQPIPGEAKDIKDTASFRGYAGQKVWEDHEEKNLSFDEYVETLEKNLEEIEKGFRAEFQELSHRFPETPGSGPTEVFTATATTPEPPPVQAASPPPPAAPSLSPPLEKPGVSEKIGGVKSALQTAKQAKGIFNKGKALLTGSKLAASAATGAATGGISTAIQLAYSAGKKVLKAVGSILRGITGEQKLEDQIKALASSALIALGAIPGLIGAAAGFAVSVAAMPVLIAIISAPLLVAFFLFMINSGAYIVPPHSQLGAATSTCSSVQDSDVPNRGKWIDSGMKDNYIDLASRWCNRVGQNLAEECYNDVIVRSINAGVNPAFTLTIWLNETAASNYTCSGYGAQDFGINDPSIAMNYNEQLDRFLRLPFSPTYMNCLARFNNWIEPMHAFLNTFQVGGNGCSPSNSNGNAYYRAIKGNYGQADSPWQWVTEPVTYCLDPDNTFSINWPNDSSCP